MRLTASIAYSDTLHSTGAWTNGIMLTKPDVARFDFELRSDKKRWRAGPLRRFFSPTYVPAAWGDDAKPSLFVRAQLRWRDDEERALCSKNPAMWPGASLTRKRREVQVEKRKILFSSTNKKSPDGDRGLGGQEKPSGLVARLPPVNAVRRTWFQKRVACVRTSLQRSMALMAMALSWVTLANQTKRYDTIVKEEAIRARACRSTGRLWAQRFLCLLSVSTGPG